MPNRKHHRKLTTPLHILEITFAQLCSFVTSLLPLIDAWCNAAGTESAQELLERAAESSGADLGNGDAPVRFDGRAFRRALNKTGRYVRQPSNDKESLALMEEHGVGYSSTGLIARMRQNGNTWQEGVSLPLFTCRYLFEPCFTLLLQVVGFPPCVTLPVHDKDS